MKINLIKKQDLNTKETNRKTPVGFSWKYLLFGPIYPLLKFGIVHGLKHIFLWLITLGISLIVMPFLYNRQAVKKYISLGYLPTDDLSKGWIYAKLNRNLDKVTPI